MLTFIPTLLCEKFSPTKIATILYIYIFFSENVKQVEKKILLLHCHFTWIRADESFDHLPKL